MKRFLGFLGTLLFVGGAWAQQAAQSVPEGTPLKVRLETTLSTFSNKAGDPFTGKISEPVMVDGKSVIPVGATVEGRVLKVSEPRRIKGKPTIAILPEHVVMPDGQRYMLNAVLVDTNIPGTDVNQEGQFKGSGHDRRDQLEVGAGAAGGMLIGGLIGSGPGLLIGGAIGAGAATGHWLVQTRSAVMPSGTQLFLELSRPLVMTNSTAGAGQ